MKNVLRKMKEAARKMSGKYFIRRSTYELYFVAQEIVKSFCSEILEDLNIPMLEIMISTESPSPGSGFRLAEFEAIYSNLYGYLHRESKVTLYIKNIYVSECIDLKLKNKRFSVPMLKSTYKAKILESLAHELRHAYQHYYSVHLDDMALTMIPDWDFDIYYESQHERDARRYADKITAKHFNITSSSLKTKKKTFIREVLRILGLR